MINLGFKQHRQKFVQNRLYARLKNVIANAFSAPAQNAGRAGIFSLNRNNFFDSLFEALRCKRQNFFHDRFLFHDRQEMSVSRVNFAVFSVLISVTQKFGQKVRFILRAEISRACHFPKDAKTSLPEKVGALPADRDYFHLPAFLDPIVYEFHRFAQNVAVERAAEALVGSDNQQANFLNVSFFQKRRVKIGFVDFAAQVLQNFEGGHGVRPRTESELLAFPHLHGRNRLHRLGNLGNVFG